MHPVLRILPMTLAAASASLASDARGDCASAKRISMLEGAYVALLTRPDSPRSAEVALYVKVISETMASEASPEIQGALKDLATLAGTVRASGGALHIDDAARSRHIENISRLDFAWRATGCSEADLDTTRRLSAESRDTQAESEDTGTEEAHNGAARPERGARSGLAPLPVDVAQWAFDLASVFTARRLAVAAIAVALCAAIWLAVVAARKFGVDPIRCLPRADSLIAWHRPILASVTRNRRRAPHHVLGRFFDVTRPESGIARRVKVADLSVFGAKLAWPDPPAPASRLHLNLDGIHRNAVVVWVNAHFCGIDFETPLTAPELKMILIAPEAPKEASGELEMF